MKMNFKLILMSILRVFLTNKSFVKLTLFIENHQFVRYWIPVITNSRIKHQYIESFLPKIDVRFHSLLIQTELLLSFRKNKATTLISEQYSSFFRRLEFENISPEPYGEKNSSHSDVLRTLYFKLGVSQFHRQNHNCVKLFFNSKPSKDQSKLK